MVKRPLSIMFLGTDRVVLVLTNTLSEATKTSKNIPNVD